jgi:hypothetical protein
VAAQQSASNRFLKELRIPVDPMVVGGVFAAAAALTGCYGYEIWPAPYWARGTCRLAGADCKAASRLAFTSGAWACPGAQQAILEMVRYLLRSSAWLAS